MSIKVKFLLVSENRDAQGNFEGQRGSITVEEFTVGECISILSYKAILSQEIYKGGTEGEIDDAVEGLINNWLTKSTINNSSDFIHLEHQDGTEVMFVRDENWSERVLEHFKTEKEFEMGKEEVEEPPLSVDLEFASQARLRALNGARTFLWDLRQYIHKGITDYSGSKEADQVKEAYTVLRDVDLDVEALDDILGVELDSDDIDEVEEAHFVPSN